MKRFLATIMTMAIIVSLSAPAMAVNDDGKYNGSCSRIGESVLSRMSSWETLIRW